GVWSFHSLQETQGLTRFPEILLQLLLQVGGTDSGLVSSFPRIRTYLQLPKANESEAIPPIDPTPVHWTAMRIMSTSRAAPPDMQRLCHQQMVDGRRMQCRLGVVRRRLGSGRSRACRVDQAEGRQLAGTPGKISPRDRRDVITSGTPVARPVQQHPGGIRQP